MKTYRRFLLLIALWSIATGLSIARGETRPPLTLTYLGNAGWQIVDGHTVIVVDPFVSQFHYARMGNPNTADDSDDILVPDEEQIAAHIPKADFILVTHSHSDHMLDVPMLAKRTGAVIIGSEGSANIARANQVPEKQLIIVKGGEDLEFGRFSLRVIPSLHSPLFAKHYNNSEFAGPVLSGSMNYIEREMQGLRPDIALVGSGASRGDIYDYSGRLMRALGNPSIVFPTHWDSYANATVEHSRREVEAFSAEIKAVSPNTRVIIPEYFKPMVLK